MNLRTICLLLSLGTGTSFAIAPAPPSNLKVKALGANAFALSWKDNSSDESGWEILGAVGSPATLSRVVLIPTPDRTSYVVTSDELPGKTLYFQMRSYKGPAGAEEFSVPTSVVAVKAFTETTFGDPTELLARAIDDGSVRLTWKDNSTTEVGYEIYYRAGKEPWKLFGSTGPDRTFSFPLQGFDPATRYAFRVRAFKNNPPIYSGYSNVSRAQTLPFSAPESLVAKPQGEGAIALKWRDRSSIEKGFELEWGVAGQTTFNKLGEVGPNVTSTTPIPGFALKTGYRFRMRAFREVDGKRVHSAWSNLATATSSPLAKPTELVVKSVGEDSIRIAWKDVSSRELGYTIRYRRKGATTFSDINLGQNATGHTIGDLAPGRVHQIQVRAFDFTSTSAFTPKVAASTRDGLTGDFDPPIFWNASFLHTVGVSSAARLTDITVTGLPAGLSFDRSTRRISGKTTLEGVFKATVNATFGQTVAKPRALMLRVIRPEAAPVATAAFEPVTVAVGATAEIATGGRFADPDTPAARRFTTDSGTFDIILYRQATPRTVSNFLAYADSGKFQNSFFHRSAPGFVVQGGGYTHDGAAFGKVATSPAVLNEPGISNLKGTVAMAKLGGDPNSATSQFFVNLSDANAENLDYQNGGFTVFGRIAGSGMDLFHRIDAMPERDYKVTVAGSEVALDDVPVNVTPPAPATIDPAKLVRITGVAPVAALRFEATSADPAVATVGVAGGRIRVTGVATGSTTVTVKAIDLDGESVGQSIAVTVP